MTFKFIHSLFEIDLHKYRLEIVEENQWFKDSFFVKYSFPFDVKITRGLDTALGMISDQNSASFNTIFEGDLYIGNKHHSATLEIDKIDARTASVKITYGFDEFPNFEKKLSQLPLEVLHIEDTSYDSIYQLAADIITKNYGDTNYNFPKIIPPKDLFDTESDQFEFFEGFINNANQGTFIQNEFDAQNNVQKNRNVVQPMPYLLYVLNKGFEDAGFTLGGDILNDQNLKKLIIVTESDFYKTINEDATEFIVKTSDPHEVEPHAGGPMGSYSKTITISNPGYYNISGNIIMRTKNLAYSKILVNSENVYEKVKFSSSGYREFFDTVEVNFNISPEQEPFNIYFESLNLEYSKNQNGQINNNASILDLSITQVSKYGSNGELLPTLITPKTVDLRKSVPDMTFGDLVRAVKLLGNYEVVAKPNNTIEMNKIQPKLNAPATLDLRDKEVKYPIREFQKSKTFLLKYTDITSDEYQSQSVFINKDGYQTSGYTKEKDTNEIIINALPLPQKTQKGVTTANDFEDDNSKLKLVSYTGGAINETDAVDFLNIINVYTKDYADWIKFRINANIFSWKYKTIIEKAFLQSAYDKAHAYARDHITKKITKKYLSPDIVEIEIETES